MKKNKVISYFINESISVLKIIGKQVIKLIIGIIYMYLEHIIKWFS